MHLDVEQTQRLLHGELDAGEEAALRGHVAGCALCERRLQDAAKEDAEVVGLLRALDHRPPQVRAGTIAARASGGMPAWGRLAAGVVLALAAAGALYAVPGSPLPRLLRGVTERIAPADPPPPPAAPNPPVAAEPSGVAVAPGRELAIVFTAPQERGVARVRVVDAREATVRALGARVSFDVDPDRITVANGGAAADYEVLLPRSARSVRVQVAGATVLRVEGGRVVSAVAPDPSGVYVVPVRP